MSYRHLVLALILLMTSKLHAEVFSVDEHQSLMSILLFASLDWYNGHYNEENLSPLTLENIRALDKNDVNFFDRTAINRYRASYDNAASALVLGTMGSTFYFSVYDEPYSWDNLVVLSEILIAQSALAKWTKSLSKRTRPYVYHQQTADKKKTDKDARLSFYSFHTSTAFATAVYNHYYQHNLHRTNNYVVWLNYMLASSVAITSVLAGKHHITDVLTGAAAGSLVSYFICSLRGRRSTFGLRFSREHVNIGFRF